MKRELSTTTIVAVLAAVIIVGGVGLFFFFKPSIGQGPPLEPKPWKPPAQWAGAPGTGTGAPAGQGAPAAPTSGQKH